MPYGVRVLQDGGDDNAILVEAWKGSTSRTVWCKVNAHGEDVDAPIFNKLRWNWHCNFTGF